MRGERSEIEWEVDGGEAVTQGQASLGDMNRFYKYTSHRTAHKPGRKIAVRMSASSEKRVRK